MHRNDFFWNGEQALFFQGNIVDESFASDESK
jgi:hypothetical protein